MRIEPIKSCQRELNAMPAQPLGGEDDIKPMKRSLNDKDD